jgi:TrmH family RNA methyltransferase
VKRVVLVRTLGPRNVGMVLRATTNFGPAELWLVAPQRPAMLLHPEFEQMAHGVSGARERVRVVATLEEALVDTTSAVGFTARARGDRARSDWRAVQDEVLEEARDPRHTVALVFGSEENGLTGLELARCRTICSIATSQEHGSINLAMSVGIVLASLFEGRALRRREGTRHLVAGADLEYLKEHLKAVLGRVARGAKVQRDIVESIERVFSRAPVESRDARAWHQVLRALDGDFTPLQAGLEGPPKARRRKTSLGRALGDEHEDAPPPD